MYRLMALGRQFDRRAMNLQRQGRLGTFPPGEGQEATQIGSAYAIGPEDWIYPSYREHALQIARGMPAVGDALLLPRSSQPRLGRTPVPDEHPHDSDRHAVAACGRSCPRRPAGRREPDHGGLLRGRRHLGERLPLRHELRRVSGRPPPSSCVPTTDGPSRCRYGTRPRRPRWPTRPSGYGMPGLSRWTGWMCWRCTPLPGRRSSGRAAAAVPTLIEAVTYRYGPHATADNPSLYRSDEEEVSAWRGRDPLVRFKRFLVRRKDCGRTR